MCNSESVIKFNNNNNNITCKFVCTHAAFNLKRIPGELYTVSLIKLNRALSRINLTILTRSPIYACITCLTEWAFP